MSWANGNHSMQLPESKERFVRLMTNEGFVDRNMHLLELAVALGIMANQRIEVRVKGEVMKDIAKVGQFDPDGVLAEIIMDRYGHLDEKVRLNHVMEHAMWGMQRIEERFRETKHLDIAGLTGERRSSD